MTTVRGKLRFASTASPAENVTYCQPSYAQSTAIIASPSPAATEPGGPEGPCVSAELDQPFPKTSSTTLITTIAPALSAVLKSCTFALARVPRTLMALTTTTIATAMLLALTTDN